MTTAERHRQEHFRTKVEALAMSIQTKVERRAIACNACGGAISSNCKVCGGKGYTLKPERHAIDTESFRCSCKAPMCFKCGACSKLCDCTQAEQ